MPDSTPRRRLHKPGSKARTRPAGGKAGQNPSPEAVADPGARRLQQVLAAAGLGSRRQCETLITDGRVEVDGTVCDQLGTRVDPERQRILVDGEPVRVERKLYFMLNKPPGVVSTSRDPAGRPRVIDLIPTNSRVYNVGRLDRTSEGLIIVTNDGDLANRLTHPSYEIEKRYLVEVAGIPDPEQLALLEKGVHLAEGFARASRVEPRRTTRRGTILEITLREGRNREIRRLLARVGHKVLRLKRIAIGPLVIGDLPPGESRRLTSEEVALLQGLAAGRKKKMRGRQAKQLAREIEQRMVSDFRGKGKLARHRKSPPASGHPRAGGKGGKPAAGKPAPEGQDRRRRAPAASFGGGGPSGSGRRRSGGFSGRDSGKPRVSGGKGRPARPAHKGKRGRPRGGTG